MIDFVLVLILGILTYLFLINPVLFVKIFYTKKISYTQLRKEKKELRYLGIIFLIGFILTLLSLLRYFQHG